MGAEMRRSTAISLFATGLYLGLSGTATTAELPLKAPPIALFGWTGFYGGVNTGYSWGHSGATTEVNPAVGPPYGGASYSDTVPHRGWEASVEGGYCWQQDPRSPYVACLEARYDFPAERSPTTTTVTAITDTTVYANTRIDPILIGPHLGFLTNGNRTMWYGAGGLALGKVGGSSVGTGILGTSTANPASAWAAGWYVGAGVEQMLTNNWGVKVEYDYVRLDTGGVSAPYSGSNTILNYPGFPSTAIVGAHPFDNVVTVGINYHLH
jgi:outer membrane immunogenic protein